MHLDFIEADNFRNVSGKIFWGTGLNIIYGNNGQGKTNWLEAIYLLSRTKSFRTRRLQESISFGQEMASVRGQVSSGSEIRRQLQISLQGNTKYISVNEKKETLARYLGQVPAFAFTADDLEVVRGMPEARRRFIDRGISSLNPAYVQTLSNYNKVVKQKNRILQQSGDRQLDPGIVEELLTPWNDQLVQLAGQIHRARTEYVRRMNNVLEQRLFESSEVLVHYVSFLNGKGDLSDYESLLAERLRLRMTAEIASGHTLLGPHRDDLAIVSAGQEIKAFGSAGQQRSALLLLDLAAISLYNLEYDDYPIFLVDDVDAELDEKRIEKLLQYLEGRTQTFITTSKRSHVQEFFSRATVYEIEDGKVVPSAEV